MPICLAPSYGVTFANSSLTFDLCPRYARSAGVALLQGTAHLISYSRPRRGGPRARNSALTNLGASLASLVGSCVVTSAVVSTMEEEEKGGYKETKLEKKKEESSGQCKKEGKERERERDQEEGEGGGSKRGFLFGGSLNPILSNPSVNSGPISIHSAGYIVEYTCFLLFVNLSLFFAWAFSKTRSKSASSVSLLRAGCTVWWPTCFVVMRYVYTCPVYDRAPIYVSRLRGHCCIYTV